jgi:hypothetical protein
MELMLVPDDNKKYSPVNIKNGSLDNQLVFLQNASSDIKQDKKKVTITINCRCHKCIKMCVQGDKSGGIPFYSFAHYYEHICSVTDKDVEIFKCPCKGCPWSVVRVFSAMIKHLRIEHEDIYQEFNDLCESDFTKLWISIDNNEWKGILKGKKIVTQPVVTEAPDNEIINWDNEPQLAPVPVMPVWVPTPMRKMVQKMIGPLEKPQPFMFNGKKYSPPMAPWEITLDPKNNIFIGIMEKNTEFYIGFCPNERPLAQDEPRTVNNNNYCCNPDCKFDHMNGWSKYINDTFNQVPVDDLAMMELNVSDIESDSSEPVEDEPKQRRVRKNNRENPDAFN